MTTLSQQLKLGGSTLALVAATLVPALAQPADAPAPVEEVTVTGTSIRGVAPVGANLVTVDQNSIQKQGGQTLDEVLKQVPALSNMGQVGQGQHNSTYFSPNIHQLGASASGSTLVIMDGLRFPLGGTSHSQPDPSIIPTIAIQRVEVLADGSSSIYGSDAVAGVINFITRSDYDGLMLQAEGGGADDYVKYNVSGLMGATWEGGGGLVAVQHSYISDIPMDTRVFTQNFIPFGGTNQRSFACSPATIQPAGSSQIYLSPTATTPVANSQVNAPCDLIYGDYLPKETRDNLMVKFHQDFGNLTIGVTGLIANRKDVTYSTAGTITATAFGTGPQANPFYTNPPGVAANSQTVRYDFGKILPPAISPQGASTMYGNISLRYRFDHGFLDGWDANLWAVTAQDNAYADTYNGFCNACALQALNGTTQTSGSTTATPIVGTTIVPLQLPLTTANALDVWSPADSNRTSAATIARIRSLNTSTTQFDSFTQFKFSASGPLFDLPGGTVRAALGAEALNYATVQKVTKTNSTGPSSYGSGFSVFHFPRSVRSFFGEIDVPIVGPEMNVPLVNKFEVDVSGRYDDYSDVGQTANPKFAADWTIIPGLKVRGSYSTSFVAPQTDSIGDPTQNYRAAYGGAGLFSTPISFPTALYPGTAGVLPGCAANATTCQVGTASTQGITVQRGIGPSAQPQKGNGYTLGVDWAPDFLPGFSANVTLFSAHFKGAVTSPNASVLPQVPSLNYLFQICPTGCSAAQVADTLAPYPTLNSAIPSTVYVIDDQSQNNIENLRAQGLDIAINYDFDTDFGHFGLGTAITEFLQYDISFGYPVEGPVYSLLNTDGQTSQFPEIQHQSRSTIGWSLGPWSVDLFMNFTGSYRNWATPAIPLTRDANGNPSGGGDPVKAYATFDIHAAYDFEDGILAGDQIYITMNNFTDAHPPFYNSQGQASITGTDDLVTNLVGRLTTVGIRAKF
ncbi:MAG TPA: TonB-dependent receptor [Rhizomicrobium sp.]|jgi:iron complex outermembrane receptor protein|nr:TonB-dependent receptor [Rhizomicrobium sp.]